MDRYTSPALGKAGRVWKQENYKADFPLAGSSHYGSFYVCALVLSSSWWVFLPSVALALEMVWSDESPDLIKHCIFVRF